MVRSIEDQVVVITGASSGIGRETALMFADEGASLVLAARNAEALQEVAREVTARGARAHIVVTDTAQWDQVKNLADEAVAHFGRIDTWVNDASVAEYATVEQMTPEEIEQVIQINLIGYIYGSKAAISAMKPNGGGTIINVASVLAELSVPLLSIYSAAKHGVKGFDDSLRMEMKHEQTGINVTTIYPSSMNTPFFENARSKLGAMPQPIPPVYEPETVARAIVGAAANPKRDIMVGGAGMLFSMMNKISPTLTDFYMLQNSRMFKQQNSNLPDDHQDNLEHGSQGEGRVHGLWSKRSMPSSLYTQIFEMNPNVKRASLAMMAGLALALVRKAAR